MNANVLYFCSFCKPTFSGATSMIYGFNSFRNNLFGKRCQPLREILPLYFHSGSPVSKVTDSVMDNYLFSLSQHPD
jgi:hypothetical protein